MTLPQRPIRPVRPKAAPKKGTIAGAKKKKATTPRAARKLEDHSTRLLWITLALAALFIAGVAYWIGAPQLLDYFHSSTNPVPPVASKAPVPVKPAPAPGLNPSPSTPTPEQQRLAEIQSRVAQDLRQEVERPVSSRLQVPAPLTPLQIDPPQVRTATPPVTVLKAVPPPPPSIRAVRPTPVVAAARALPVNPEKLDSEQIAAYQVALERLHFSCGFIDGDVGMRTQRMLRAFQASRFLPITGQFDSATRAAIGEPGEPFLTYTLTADDLASLMPKPIGWRAKAAAKRLGYSDMWEMLGEKFHCARAYLKQLNPAITSFAVGTTVIGPKVYPAAALPKIASLRVNLAETCIEPLDARGRILAFFPCSIAADKNKRPNGELRVVSAVPNPDYTFDPALFKEAAAAEGLTHKMTLPPGPRNPVGTVWIGLSLPGYGMHGTPEPENISRTQSHGCFRLANWNAEKLLKMVRVGMLVDVEP